jgi:hypothetical protein
VTVEPSDLIGGGAVLKDRQVWLLIPVAMFCAVDVLLTLSGQSAEYWSGRFDQADEANPVARPMLKSGPALFIFMAAGELLAIGIALLRWRHAASKWLAAVVAAAHAIGGAAWMTRWGGWGWLVAGLYLFVASECASHCWRRARESS